MQAFTKQIWGLTPNRLLTSLLKNRFTSCSITVAGCGVLLLCATNTGFGAQSSKTSTSVHTQSAHRAAQFGHSENDVTLDFVAADINDVLKALAVQTGANIVSSADVKGTITVSLSHVTLEQALDMVARLSGFEYAKANNAYIIGTPAGITAFTQPVSSNEPQVTEVIPLHYSTIDDVTSLLKLRFPSIQISSGTQIAGEKAGGNTSAIVLYGQQDMIEQAKQLIQSLEDNLGQRVASENTETYTAKYVSLGDLITILNTLVPSLNVTTGPSMGFSTKAPSASASASSSSSSQSGTSPAPTSSTSSSSSTPGTGTSTQTSTGPSMLLMTGTTADIAKARDLLAKVDVKPSQILYEAKVTEISSDDQKNIGLKWDFTHATTRIGELADNTAKGPAVLGDNGYVGSVAKFGTFGRTAISDLADVSLDALIADNKAKLLSDPNIAAIDGYPAQVFIGDTINYVQSITQTTTGENVTTASVQVGVILRVTGKLNPDGYITLNIHPEVSSITSYLAVPGGGSLPQIANRYADTTIRVKDGQTIAIGGLISDQDIVNVQKVPFFGDLPFFGNFFKDTQHDHKRDEVVFFLKTSVMKDI